MDNQNNMNNGNSNTENNFSQQSMQQNSNMDNAQNFSQYNSNINGQPFIQNGGLNNNQSQNIQYNNMNGYQNTESLPIENIPQNQFNSNQSNLSSNQNPTSNLDVKNNKSKLLILVIIILAIIAVIILVVNLTSKNQDNSTNSAPNISNNNSTNTSSNNSVDNSKNNSSNTTDDNSSSELETIPLNTYANIGEKVEMKVNSSYIEDKFYYSISTTFKNNGNNDIILKPGVSEELRPSFAYFQGYFVYKGADFDNITDEDILDKSCFISKIVQDDGTEVRITSKKEDTILKSGEEMNTIVNCTIANVKDYANGVEPGMLRTQHLDSDNKIETYFNLRK